MLKAVGAFLIIIAGTVEGFAQARKLNMRVLFIEQYLKFLNYIQTQIRYSAGTLAQIITSYLGSASLLQSFTSCIDKINSGDTFSDAWSGAAAKIPKEFGLSKEDYQLISDFGTGLGTSDTQGQLAHCEMHISFLTQQLKEARESKQKKGKLYFMLGVFLGIGSALLFI